MDIQINPFNEFVIGFATTHNQYVLGSIPGDLVIRYKGRILVSHDNGTHIHTEVPAAKPSIP